jgi:hypothetical protein
MIFSLKRLFRLQVRQHECLEELRAAAVDCLEELRQSGERSINVKESKQKLVDSILAKADEPLGHTIARKILRLRVRTGSETIMESIEWSEQIIENIEDEMRAIENRQMVALAAFAVVLSIVAVVISISWSHCG